ncbi:MAG: 4Fe-4S binding protein [Bacteroidetes bacterium]|nr:4Fe-4S binding protein [Bacteroidota bacterium]
MDKQYFHHALKISEANCIGCTHCIKVCPTEAIRVKNGKAHLFENRCVDCGECFRVCPVNAIYVDHDDFNQIFNYKYRIALVPGVLIGQFPENITTQQIYSELLEIGFTHVFEVEHTVDILIEAREDFKKKNPSIKPLISTFCPAVIRLIQVKFPALVENLILLKSPLDIAALYYKKLLTDQGIAEEEIGLFYITPCAAKIAAVKSPVGENKSEITGVINLDFIYNKVYKSIKQSGKKNCMIPHSDELDAKGILWSLTNGEKDTTDGRALAVDEIHNVIDFLEKIESDEISDVDFLELRACDESCAGGVLTSGNRFLTVERMKKRAKASEIKINDSSCFSTELQSYKKYLIENMNVSKIMPRSMLKLDENMSEAIKKMGKMRDIMEYLPKTDCGMCGASTCQTLAEDIVMQRADITDCVFIQRTMEQKGSMTMNEAIAKMKRIWGDKFNTK